MGTAGLGLLEGGEGKTSFCALHRQEHRKGTGCARDSVWAMVRCLCLVSQFTVAEEGMALPPSTCPLPLPHHKSLLLTHVSAATCDTESPASSALPGRDTKFISDCWGENCIGQIS